MGTSTGIGERALSALLSIPVLSVFGGKLIKQLTISRAAATRPFESTTSLYHIVRSFFSATETPLIRRMFSDFLTSKTLLQLSVVKYHEFGQGNRKRSRLASRFLDEWGS